MKKTKCIKGISIKTRITLWYTITVLAIAVLAMGIMYIGTIRMTEAEIRSRLSTATELASKAVMYRNGGVEVSDHQLEDITEAEILVLGKEGDIYYGNASIELTQLKMTDGAYQRVSVNGYRYYVYDTLRTFENNPNHAVWIRTYYSLNLMQLLSDSMLRIWIIILPSLLIISAIIGFVITRRAFRPIGLINKIAREIADSGDLTKRITMQEMQKDELYDLSATFNDMFSKLEMAFESEKQFTSDASHELRTPVAVIMAQTEYLLELYQKMSETGNRTDMQLSEQEKAVQKIYDQTIRVSKLISELLMISRMENQKLVIQNEKIDIGELAEMITEEMKEQAEKRQIEMLLDLEDGVFVIADQTMLMRVFVNLIGNAIKYGKDKGHIWICVKKEKDGRVRCSVRDDGIGIEKKSLHKIWKRFYQIDSARTIDNSGSGLGLFMAKWIIENYGGNIVVESTFEKESIFTFWLPGVS